MNSVRHGYTWADLRERPAAELAVGDVFVTVDAFVAYSVTRDGQVRPRMGGVTPGGTAWTVTVRDGDGVTARSHDGFVRVNRVPEGARVLLVVDPEPVGTVLTITSHRARKRLERALGRNPAEFYDKAMRRGGGFVVLYGDDVATALGIPSITRTRLKPDDVALCVGDGGRERREADRAVGRRIETGADR